MPRKRRVTRWIQKAIRPSKKGALHKQLGIPLGQKIPLVLLRRAAKAGGVLGRRARFALNVRGLGKRKHRSSR